MVFPSVQFAILFPVVLALSWALMGRPAAWKPFILLASYGFYAAADWKFCLLLAAVTLVNQGAAVAIFRTDSVERRKWLIRAAVVADLMLLGVFKYYGFFATELNAALDTLSLGLPVPLAAIALPVGVSFFTFQAISYVVDVHRRTIEPGTTMDVAIYLSFFPHLIAGPIVRAREFLPQLATPRDPNRIAIGAAAVLIVVGLVKKVVIADYLARTVVDPVFGVPQAYAGLDVVLAVYAYAVQIYCDFSGYTDIAIGTALLMGFVFPQNFNRPYRSASFQEFWRRWHITLSRFLRDFLYIPLGGNRKGARRTSINLFLTMLLGGLWHGAAWGFVLWGALHGGALVVEKAFRARGVGLPRWAAVLLTFHLVALFWIPFRAPELGIAGDLLVQMVTPGAVTLLAPLVVLLVVGVLILQLLPEDRTDAFRLRVENLRPAPLGVGLALTVVLVAATVPSQGVPPFIYFAF